MAHSGLDNTFIPGIGWHVAVLPVAGYLADSTSLRRFFFLSKYLLSCFAQ